MAVGFASQVLSQTTAARLKAWACADRITRKTAKKTSSIIQYLDRVIDLFNGCKLNDGDRKKSTTRTYVTSTSYHWQFWPRARQMIKSLKFFRPDGVQISRGTNSKNQTSPTIIQLQDLLTAADSITSSKNFHNSSDANYVAIETDETLIYHLENTDENLNAQLNSIFDGIQIEEENDLAKEDTSIPEKLFCNISKSPYSKSCSDCKSNFLSINESGSLQIAPALQNQILKAINVFNTKIKSRLHEKNVCILARSLIVNQLSECSVGCSKHAEALNVETSEKVVSFLIRQLYFLVNRKIELDEMKTANLQKIPEFTGKAK